MWLLILLLLKVWVPSENFKLKLNQGIFLNARAMFDFFGYSVKWLVSTLAADLKIDANR